MHARPGGHSRVFIGNGSFLISPGHVTRHMTFTFNLLVSTPRNFETEALAEMDFLMYQLYPDEQFNYGKTIIRGLVWGNLVSKDPVSVVHAIREHVDTQHFPVQFMLKFVPVQQVLLTNIDVIRDHIRSRVGEIARDETFKILVNKRRIQLDRAVLIDSLAKEIERTVNLDNPDKIVRLEIIGKYTGFSILQKDDVYSIGKTTF